MTENIHTRICDRNVKFTCKREISQSQKKLENNYLCTLQAPIQLEASNIEYNTAMIRTGGKFSGRCLGIAMSANH